MTNMTNTTTTTTPEGTPTMTTMNTTTHEIRASYTFPNGTGEWHSIDTDGDNFAEIVDEMLAFWNEVGNSAGEFTVARTFKQDDYTTVTEIVGTVHASRDGDDAVDAVIVQVAAVER